MDLEIAGCGGQPSIHWAAAQTQSKQTSAGGLNNPNTAAEWKEEHLHNSNATVCSLSTNGEWADWGWYHYRFRRAVLRATGHSFSAEPEMKTLAFRFINLVVYEITIKLLFWALMVIVNIKTGFYELIISRLHKRRHLTFRKHFSRPLSSCLTGPQTQSFFDASFHTSKVQCKSHLEYWQTVWQRAWKSPWLPVGSRKPHECLEYHRSHW